jgi:glucose/arabinose dehydrogenase
VWLVTPTGEKTPINNVPPVLAQGQGGMLGVFVSPHYATDHSIYLTYAEPGTEAGTSGLALTRATLSLGTGTASFDNLQVLWRELPKGRGGQFGAQIAFSPDGQYLFLTVGDRQRMTPAQDPNSALGKIFRLTLDGKPAPGNPMAGKTGGSSLPLINPPRDTEAAKTAQVISEYTVEGQNLVPAMTWSSGHRTPYGLAFGPDGKLWELEHGPRGGDELNLIEPGKNYGWPEVSYGVNYNGVPIPNPETKDFVKPVIYWTPVIAPGNLTFYKGAMFPQWNGSALISGIATTSLSRVTFDGNGGATPAERWNVGKRLRDVEVAADGALWVLEDNNPGGLYRVTPK